MFLNIPYSKYLHFYFNSRSKQHRRGYQIFAVFVCSSFLWLFLNGEPISHYIYSSICFYYWAHIISSIKSILSLISYLLARRYYKIYSIFTISTLIMIKYCYHFKLMLIIFLAVMAVYPLRYFSLMRRKLVLYLIWVSSSATLAMFPFLFSNSVNYENHFAAGFGIVILIMIYIFV